MITKPSDHDQAFVDMEQFTEELQAVQEELSRILEAMAGGSEIGAELGTESGTERPSLKDRFPQFFPPRNDSIVLPFVPGKEDVGGGPIQMPYRPGESSGDDSYEAMSYRPDAKVHAPAHHGKGSAKGGHGHRAMRSKGPASHAKGGRGHRNHLRGGSEISEEGYYHRLNQSLSNGAAGLPRAADEGKQAHPHDSGQGHGHPHNTPPTEDLPSVLHDWKDLAKHLGETLGKLPVVGIIKDL